MRSAALATLAVACGAQPPAAHPTDDHTHTLIVGGEGGLIALDVATRAQHELTATPVARPRFVPGTYDLVFYVPPRRELRRIYPLRRGAWPAPLTAAELSRIDDVESADAVGESTVFWLPHDDVAVIDHLLVVTGRSIDALPGDVAR